jgi:UDP:flavonoid glycosyltransferase YjiC (YdhE family)
LALGSYGDILPLATLGQGLVATGHQVRLVTFENFKEMVTTHGLNFHAIRGDSRAILNAGGGLELAESGQNVVRMWLTAMRSFGTLAEGYAHDLSSPELAETDVIINQLPGGLYGYDLAEKLNIPMLGAAVMPLTRTRSFPMLAFPAGFARFPGYNALSYHLAEQSVWQVFRPTINRWRTKTLGLPKQRFGGNFGQVGTQQYPILNGFSAHVVPRPLDWSEHVHITGYWFPRDEVWQPPDSLRKFIESGTPPVFIGFGSMPVRQPKQTTAVILKALKLSGQRAILHAGWAGIGDDDLPETVYKIDYAPYAWLFPQMAAVVHHGGSGTTAFGLRAGIPTLIIPFRFDQFSWGRRIATLGMGPKPVPFRNLSAARLGRALAIAATDSQMGQRATALGQKIQQEEGVKKAVTIVEHYLRSSD